MSELKPKANPIMDGSGWSKTYSSLSGMDIRVEINGKRSETVQSIDWRVDLSSKQIYGNIGYILFEDSDPWFDNVDKELDIRLIGCNEFGLRLELEIGGVNLEFFTMAMSVDDIALEGHVQFSAPLDKFKPWTRTHSPLVGYHELRIEELTAELEHHKHRLERSMSELPSNS